MSIILSTPTSGCACCCCFLSSTWVFFRCCYFTFRAIYSCFGLDLAIARLILIRTIFRLILGKHSGGTESADDAFLALRPPSFACCLTKPDEHRVDFCPIFLRQPVLECLSGLLWFFSLNPSKTIHYPMHMHVYPYSSVLPPCRLHAQIRHLWSNSWQFTHFLYSFGYISRVIPSQYLSSLFHIYSFSPKKPCGIYEVFQLLCGCVAHRIDA
mmetsp:Transcript_31606/g.55577  ORF Transcript_31606/g.55577 Transcript_31606/m.55577 type:complete len:212 (+) Transcript_31606:354-989(+)